jgi:hypothetical protein
MAFIFLKRQLVHAAWTQQRQVKCYYWKYRKAFLHRKLTSVTTDCDRNAYHSTTWIVSRICQEVMWYELWQFDGGTLWYSSRGIVLPDFSVRDERSYEICDFNNGQQRLRWSRGSVLAFGTQVRGFKPGFFGRKNPQHAFLRRGSKADCPMSCLMACNRTQKWRGSLHFRQSFSAISRP